MKPTADAGVELRVAIIRKRDGWSVFGRQKFQTVEMVKYRGIEVHPNFETNFGSIPFGFRWLIRPLHWRSCRCYVVHDFMCGQAKTWAGRLLADSYLQEFLYDQGFRWRVPVIYAGVRIGAYWWALRGYKR